MCLHDGDLVCVLAYQLTFTMCIWGESGGNVWGRRLRLGMGRKWGGRSGEEMEVRSY